jgi:hypothetical protein
LIRMGSKTKARKVKAMERRKGVVEVLY